MPVPTTSGKLKGDPFANQLLAHLTAREWELLRPHARIVTLKQPAVLFSEAEPADVTYFPLTSIISMITVMANGDECEYGCIGREGMLGLHVALTAQPLRGLAMCQLNGQAVRFDGEVLRKLTLSGKAPKLHQLLLRYAQASINVLAQSAACNALHAIPQRTARWLLQSRDRAGSNSFSLTQEFLSMMLGVRRPSVTEVAADLRRRKIIEYQRGHINVLNSKALEAAACECYHLIRNEYDLVFESPTTLGESRPASVSTPNSLCRPKHGHGRMRALRPPD